MENDLNKDEALVRDFLIESEELLQGMDQDMVALESAPRDADLLNRIFRALHTIKGTSGFLGFDPVVRVSHRAEDVLNALRRGELQLTPAMMNVLLKARDQLGKMLVDIRQGGLQEYSLEALLAERENIQKPSKPKALDADAAETLTTNSSEPKLDSAVCSAGAPETLTEKVTSTQDAGAPSALPPSGAAPVNQTMRVDVRKLDDLINLVGELVLERNRLIQLNRDLAAQCLSPEELSASLGQSTARLSFVTEELQVTALKTRMVPIDLVFRKFPRLVRDVAHTLQKEVELVLQGQDTELDKTMVELIGDPLVHLIRNSLDHGIEKPELRQSLGKPRHGTIHLSACQEGDQIVIKICDDGAGIDPARVGRKAVEKGLVTPERLQTISPREILDFIFLPGFSTVEKASDLSGRGVGMDVVRSNLKKMNGSISLDSTPGQGTTIGLKLPLTLAILPVLLVRVADEIYGLPLRSVLETVRVESGQVHLVEGREVLRVRGQTLPLLRLTDIFAIESGPDSGGRAVILGVAERRVALLVDGLVGQESTVIKPLSSYLHHCSSLAGATVSGDGRVRLVLDPAGLVSAASSRTALTASGATQ